MKERRVWRGGACEISLMSAAAKICKNIFFTSLLTPHQITFIVLTHTLILNNKKSKTKNVQISLDHKTMGHCVCDVVMYVLFLWEIIFIIRQPT